MNKTQNPFNVYDFLGYITPGIFIITGLYMIKCYEAIQSSGLIIWISKLQEKISLESYVPLIVIFYIIGHIVNYLSAIIIERHSVLYFDYPSKYLIKKGDPQSYSVKKEYGNAWDWICRTIVYAVTLPLCVFPYLLKNKFARSMDDIYIEPYINKSKILSKKLLNHDITESNDAWRLIYHHMIEIESCHFAKYQNYVALYGFTRAISFCFLVYFWYSIINMIFLQGSLLVVFLSICGLYIMYMAFNKFYRRFSLEVIMSFLSYDTSNEKKF